MSSCALGLQLPYAREEMLCKPFQNLFKRLLVTVFVTRPQASVASAGGGIEGLPAQGSAR
jgi:hypothetical protein